MKVLLLDNYDSFTFNLYHYLQPLCQSIEVFRSDEIGLAEVALYSHILISPGPGLPKDAGITMSLIDRFYKEKSILGVCLGHQAMCEYFGGSLYNQSLPAHGLATEVFRNDADSWLLKDLPQSFQAGLYHSWAVHADHIPADFKLTASSGSGVVMAVEHPELKLAGVQFHPESIMSDHGMKILQNWLKR